MTKKENIIENIKKNKVGLIICGIIFVGLLLLNLCKCSMDKANDKHEEINNSPITLELDYRNYNLRNANNPMSYYTNPQYMISLKIDETLSYSSNITSVPSNTWFAYFSIDSNDMSGLKWVNVYQNVYQLQYIIKNVVVDYVQYMYVGGENYIWNIGTNINGVISDIGFKSLTISSLTNEKRDSNNPEIVVETLQYYDYFVNAFLVNDNFHYLCDLSFATQDDIDLYKMINDEYITLVENYTTLNQLKIYDNRLAYKNIEVDNYDTAYNSGYLNGFNSGVDSGVNNVVNNPSNYDLYTQEQYENNYTSGVNNVVNNPNSYGLYTQTQYDDNYDLGYITAENEVTPDLATNGFKTMFNSVLNAPLNILGGILNFEFFGINVFNLFSFLFTLVLIGFVIKLLI